MLTDQQYLRIMHLVDEYNRAGIGKEGYVSPFIARANGELDKVAEKIGVPVAELDEFLTRVNQELPAVD